MIRFNYKTPVLPQDLTTVDVHLNKKVDVRLFSANEGENQEEFLVVESFDHEHKEWAKVFFHREALDQFIEQMSAICALRFKKSNP